MCGKGLFMQIDRRTKSWMKESNERNGRKRKLKAESTSHMGSSRILTAPRYPLPFNSG